MSFRAWWERYIWPPRPEPPALDQDYWVMRVCEKAMDRMVTQRQWLEQRNAELTAQLLAAKLPAPAPNAPAPETTTLLLPTEVVRALTDRMGFRWMETTAGRNAAMWATMALGEHMSAEDVAKRIYDGEEGVS